MLSEKLAFEACADLANEIMKSQNKSKRYTGEELIKTYVGQNFRGMMGSLQKDNNFTLPQDKLEEYVGREMDEVIKKILAHGEECPGATEVLEQLNQNPTYHNKMAVVSSSAGPRVEASVRKVGQDKYFGNRIYSAATSLNPPTSKPNPKIYLHALEKLNAQPQTTVAVEDSKSGATAAKRAGLWIIAYVGAYEPHEQEAMGEMLMKEVGCHQLMTNWTEFLECLERINNVSFSHTETLFPLFPFLIGVILTPHDLNSPIPAPRRTSNPENRLHLASRKATRDNAIIMVSHGLFEGPIPRNFHIESLRTKANRQTDRTEQNSRRRERS